MAGLVAAALPLLLITQDAGDNDLLALEIVPEGDVLSVVGASRRRQTLEEAPAAVSVVSGEELRRFGWRTITEVLANVRGLYVSDDHNYSYVGVRGFTRPGDYNSRVLVTVNGHPMNDATYLGALLSHEFGVDMDLVERVEIVRGPASSLYGTSALLAVINVVTRTAPDVRHLDGWGVDTAFEGDSGTATKLRLGLDRVFGIRKRVLISGSFAHDAGQSHLLGGLTGDGSMMRTAPEHDAMRALSLFASAEWGPWALQAGVNRYDKQVPTASFDSLPGEDEHTTDARGFLELKLELAPRDDLDVTFSGTFDAYRYAGRYPYAFEDGGPQEDSARSTWAGVDVLADWRVLDAVRVTAGALGQRFFDVSEAASQAGAPASLALSSSYFGAAVYANTSLELSVFELTGGARVDWMETFGTYVSPRIALITRPFEGSTLKLIYGQAFRAPNHYELYYEDTWTQPNPELRPETLRHYEAVIEQQLGAGRGLFSLGLFHYRITGMISAAVDPESGRDHFENLDHASSTGMEVEVSGRLPWLGIRAAAHYTFANTVDSATGLRLSNSPQHVAGARVTVPLHERIHVATACRYLGERPGLAGRAAAPDAFTLDVTLTLDDVIRGLDLGAGATNLLDERWFVPASADQRSDNLPQDGRRVWLELSYRF